jgi:hypothetical protein
MKWLDCTCYGCIVVLTAFFACSIALVLTAARNEHDLEAEEVFQFIEDWRERMPEFEHLHVHVESASHKIDLHLSNLLESSYVEERLNQYDHLKYYANQTLFTANDLEELEDNGAYNLSGHLGVSVTSYVDSELKQRFDLNDVPAFMFMPNASLCGNCSEESYVLSKICLVLSHNNFSIAFEPEGCEGKGLYEWTEGSPQEVYGTVIEVRSEFDPYVRAAWAGILDLPPTSTELSLIGILMLVVSSSCFFFPIVFCINKRKYRYLDLSEIEVPPRNLKAGTRM